MNKKISLISLVLEQKTRGQYEGPRRQVDVKINPGSHKSEIINNAIMKLENRYSFLADDGIFLDRREASKTANEIFSRTYPSFLTLTMWPVSDYAILISRIPSFVQFPEIITGNRKIKVGDDLMTSALTTELYAILKSDLEGFGMTHDTVKTLKLRFNIPKAQALGLNDDQEEEKPMKSDWESLVGDDKEKEETVVVKGDPYLTGNIKVHFVEPIKAKDLKDYLEMKGWDVGKGSTEDDDDDEEIKEQREINVDPVSSEASDSRSEEISTKEESPVFKTKKDVIISNIEKLSDSLDDFLALIEDNPDEEVSDLISSFSELIDKLNKMGLVGK